MAHRASWLAAACVLACGTESLPPAGGGGSGGGGTAGSVASGGGGAATGGSSSASAGSAGQAAVGGGGGGAGGSSLGGGGTGGGGAGGAVSGGEGGGAGTSGAGSSGAGAGVGGGGGSSSSLPKRVLLYHFSTLVIASVPEQLQVLGDKLRGWGYEVEVSDDPADINPQKLGLVGAVGMINTCFEPFGKGSAGTTQAAALATFVENGGGLFGTHCASVTFQTATPPHPYNQVIGGRGGDGYFDGTSSCTTVESHPTTSLLPPTFSYVGNLDNADFVADGTKILVKCQWSGGAKKDVPVSWYRSSGKGRVFYTNFAKEAADLKDASLADKHIFPGLSWVLGR